MNLLERIFENKRELTTKRMGWKRKIASGAILLASLSFFAFTLYKGWDQLREHFSLVNYWLIGGALCLYPIGFLPSAWAWHAIMKSVGGCTDFRKNLRLYALSCLPKRIPGAVWHISSRVVLYQENQTSYATTLVATVIEILFMTLSGFSIGLLVQGLEWAQATPGLRGVIIGGLTLTLTVPLWTPVLRRLIHSIQSRAGAPSSTSFSIGDALRILGILTLAWAGGGGLLYMIANAVIPLSFAEIPKIISFWGVAGATSVTAGLLVQGMGLREVTLAVLLSNSMSLSAATVVSLLFRLILTVGETVWALLFAWLMSQWPNAPKGL